jgi:hypothetical protein
MKLASEKTRVVFAVFVTCAFGLVLGGCGSKKINVPLSLIEGYEGGVEDGGDAEAETEKSASKSKSASSSCLDNLEEQRKDKKLDRTVKCEECLCKNCEDEVAAVIKDGQKAIDVVTCAEKNKVTNECLLCPGPCMGSITDMMTVFQGPCADEVCKAASIECSSSSTIVDYQAALSVSEKCTAGQDNPCGHALTLSECMLKNCPISTCSAAIVCE